MAWLNNWSYRKSVTVTNASASYQTKVLVGESSGATGEEVDCNSHCQTDFDDLRFTGADGTTLLDYWIESITGTTPNQLATIWVENNATPDTTLYMYYGKADATAVSNGANTFITFDDFERGNDGDTVGGAWTEADPHVHISTEQDIGNVTGYTGTRSMKLIDASIATIPDTPSANKAIRFRIYKENAGQYSGAYGNGTKYWNPVFFATEDLEYYDTDYRDTGVNGTADQWELCEFNDFNWTAYTLDWWWNGSRIKDGATMYTSAGSNGVFGIYSSAGGNIWIDDFIVRKWTATEPTWGSWGSEEELMYIPFKSFYPHILAH